MTWTADRSSITLVQLRYFQSAAVHLSMTAAAEEFYVAQSAVSSAIAALERGVGTQLFVRRRSKGLILTPAGSQLLVHVRELLAALDRAVESAQGVGEHVRGTLRLAFFVTIAPFALPELLSRARSLHPELSLEVVEVDAAQAIEELQSGRSEIAVGYDFGLANGIVSEVVDATPPYVLLAADHPLALKPSVGLRELGRERMILLDLPHSREYFLDLLHSVGIEPTIRHRTPSFETVRALVGHGHGYSILNQRPVDALAYDGGRVAAVPIRDQVSPLPVVISSLNGSHPSARARAVADLVRQVFADRR